MKCVNTCAKIINESSPNAARRQVRRGRLSGVARRSRLGNRAEGIGERRERTAHARQGSGARMGEYARERQRSLRTARTSGRELRHLPLPVGLVLASPAHGTPLKRAVRETIREAIAKYSSGGGGRFL